MFEMGEMEVSLREETADMGSSVLCTIDGAVLTAGASETDLEMAEPS